MNFQDWIYKVFSSRYRWIGMILILAVCSAAAIGVGYLLAEFGVLIALAGLVVLVLGLWVLRDIETAYLGVIGVVCLLPFASFPIDIGFTPTLLDAALVALFLVWMLQIATGAQREFIATPLGLPIAVFMLFALGAFVFGLGHAPPTSYLIRHFAEVMLSVALFFLVANTVREADRLRKVTRMLILCACAAAIVGIVLYIIADQYSSELAIRLLSALGRLKYPTGAGVLRYIRNDPAETMRATSTSVDPNVLGSLLYMTLALATPQLFSPTPLLRRRYLVPVLGSLALCLVLTISRGALAGAGIALAMVATLRYRKLWLILLAAAVLLLVLPQTQSYVAHFVQGVQLEDLATQMRLGEYKDAFILIGRYPWLGVGFGGSPDIDTYIGVSSMYLLIAEQMGLIGLASFLFIAGRFLFDFWRNRDLVTADPELEPIWWGLNAAIVGALVGGIVDHYFFNLDFHHSVTVFWLVIGLAAAATRIIQERIRNRTQTVGSGTD